MIALIIATLAWGIYVYFRILRKNHRLTISKLIMITVGRLIPVLILLSLSPLVTFIGGGRVFALVWHLDYPINSNHMAYGMVTCEFRAFGLLYLRLFSEYKKRPIGATSVIDF